MCVPFGFFRSLINYRIDRWLCNPERERRERERERERERDILHLSPATEVRLDGDHDAKVVHRALTLRTLWSDRRPVPDVESAQSIVTIFLHSRCRLHNSGPPCQKVVWLSMHFLVAEPVAMDKPQVYGKALAKQPGTVILYLGQSLITYPFPF